MSIPNFQKFEAYRKAMTKKLGIDSPEVAVAAATEMLIKESSTLSTLLYLAKVAKRWGLEDVMDEAAFGDLGDEVRWYTPAFRLDWEETLVEPRLPDRQNEDVYDIFADHVFESSEFVDFKGIDSSLAHLDELIDF